MCIAVAMKIVRVGLFNYSEVLSKEQLFAFEVKVEFLPSVHSDIKWQAMCRTGRKCINLLLLKNL